MLEIAVVHYCKELIYLSPAHVRYLGGLEHQPVGVDFLAAEIYSAELVIVDIAADVLIPVQTYQREAAAVDFKTEFFCGLADSSAAEFFSLSNVSGSRNVPPCRIGS